MKFNTKNIRVIFDSKEFKIYRDILYTEDETIVEHYCNTLNIEDEAEYNALHKLDAYPEHVSLWHTRYTVMTLSQAIWYIQCEWMSLGESAGQESGYEAGYHAGKTDGLDYKP